MRPLTLRTVLVATDLSDALEPALRTAAELTALAGGRLYIVHATERLPDESGLSSHLQASGLSAEVLADARTVQGPAGAVITQEAWRTEADVIVLGPHRSQFNVLGSTADRVVRAAPAPCLVLPVSLPLPLRHVLVPVDVAEGARGPLAIGVAWASALRKRGNGPGSATKVVALHIARDESTGAQGVTALRREVSSVREHLANIAGVEVEEMLEYGSDAADLILKRAEAGPADLLVLGTRGQREASGALLGSVSSAVVQRANCPVLLVPPSVWQVSARDPLP